MNLKGCAVTDVWLVKIALECGNAAPVSLPGPSSLERLLACRIYRVQRKVPSHSLQRVAVT